MTCLFISFDYLKYPWLQWSDSTHVPFTSHNRHLPLKQSRQSPLWSVSGRWYKPLGCSSVCLFQMSIKGWDELCSRPRSQLEGASREPHRSSWDMPPLSQTPMFSQLTMSQQIFQSFIPLLISHTPAVPNFIWGTMLGGLNKTNLDLLVPVVTESGKTGFQQSLMWNMLPHTNNPPSKKPRAARSFK